MAVQKEIDYEQLHNKNYNKSIIAIITVILLGYIFFFISPLLFHERPAKQLTELVTEHQFFNGTISVRDWRYSPEQHMFEVRCEFSDNIILKDIELTASCNFTYKTKKIQQLKPKIGYYTTDYLVAYINDVPEDWYCASLRITNNTSTLNVQSATETNTQTKDKDVASQLDDNLKTGSIYTCVEDVKEVPSILVLERENDFIVERAKGNIIINNDMIDKNTEKIEEYKKVIRECENNIQTLENERSFQVAAEVKTTNEKITAIKSQIEIIQRNIDELRTKNAELKSEIEEYEDVIAEYDTSTKPTETETTKPTVSATNPTQPQTTTTQNKQPTTQRSR